MAINIQNIVKTNFIIEKAISAIGSYKSVLFVTDAISTITPTTTASTTVASGSVTVSASTFSEAVSNVAGTYTFTATVSGETTTWSLASETVTLADYGISLTGTASNNDTISVVLTITTTESSSVLSAKAAFTALGGDITYFKALSLGSTASTYADSILTYKKSVSATDNDFIFVVVDPKINSSFIQTAVLSAIQAFESPYKLIVAVSTTITNYASYSSIFETNSNIVVKLHKNEVDPVAIAVAAYYCSINLNYANSLQDYCYTDESAIYQTGTGEVIGGSLIAKYGTLNATDEQYRLYKDKLNFTDIVGSSIVNFGGNLYNGVAITSQFGLIAVENDIIFAVLKAMLKKQYLTAEGLNNIVAVINTAMTRYTSNGYLEQNAKYTGQTYVENYNGISTTLIKNGAILSLGYFVGRVPMSRLSIADKQAHKFTPIRVFMQTQMGARVVEIDGTIVE